MGAAPPWQAAQQPRAITHGSGQGRRQHGHNPTAQSQASRAGLGTAAGSAESPTVVRETRGDESGPRPLQEAPGTAMGRA